MANVYLKDPTRFSIKSLVISNGRKRVVLNLTATSTPTHRLVAKRDAGDDTPISYIEDPESTTPAFLLRLDLEDELEFRFTFVSKQKNVPQVLPPATAPPANSDTTIGGLTFAYASSSKELDTLVTREFHADPNIQKSSNVQFIGDYATNGYPVIEYEWSWKYRSPKTNEDRGGGWRNTCSFLEYDSRAHRLNTLASFAFWVQNHIASPTPLPTPATELVIPRNQSRMPSSQSYHSTFSDTEPFPEQAVPPSPNNQLADFNSPVVTPGVITSSLTTSVQAPAFVDVACPRPGQDMSDVDDGPVFRATMKSLEQKTGSMRVQIKKVLKKAEAAQQAQVECNEAMSGFLAALQEASMSNDKSAIKPALDHYFNKIAKRILQYETENGNLLRRQIIEPLSKLYNLDIKQADSKKKDFEDESRDYYAYVSRYLGQRNDTLKEKKRAESDSKYQNKKRNFELARFDYSSFMQDLHGGRKEQELLSTLTRYADGQSKSFLATARLIENLQPQLEALVREVGVADKEYRIQRTEREEKRRNLEMNTQGPPPDNEVISHVTSNPPVTIQSNGGGYNSDTDLSRADSTSSQFSYVNRNLSPGTAIPQSTSNGGPISSSLSNSPGAASMMANVGKFRGIRDLEERDLSVAAAERQSGAQHRKEGLLWALSKPGSHIDPKGINKQAWHKFWIVLDQGKLSEYSNWKDKLDLHRDPIDLRMASVRMARDAERRFCFEVITPQYKRVYQATAEDDMNNWISAINNALQSAFEGRPGQPMTPVTRHESTKSEYGAVLTGKSLSQSGHHSHASKSDSIGVGRSSTVGSRPAYLRTPSHHTDESPTKLLDQLRANDQGNQYCADCGTNARVEWTSLNLGIILCIECGGIHRSLGTHVSKIRSLTLDITSFTEDTVELLMLVGNRVSNMIWEARLEQRLKLEPWANREQRLRFITAKYVERAYVSLNPAFSTPDESLLASIKRNDIQGVLQAIAQRANVNVHDRSRDTHSVFLALAAADPARPTSSSAPNAPETKSKAFAVAELLIQNGAEIPSHMPAIPLSSAAQLYVEQRTTRAGTASAGAVGIGDTLSPLPIMSGTGKSETTRLQKRGSAGARFAGKVGLSSER